MPSTAVLAHTSDTVAPQGWDEADHVMLGALRHSPTMAVFLAATGYPDAIARDALLGYLHAGLVCVVVDRGHRYELTWAGRARLAQLTATSTVPAMRRAA
jgi:hypothetical protein